MADLIRVEHGVALLDAVAAENIAVFERMIKDAKQKEDILRAAILKEMEQKGILKIDIEDLLTINYVAATDRETFDSKAFKKDHADLYDSYVSISPVKPSIRIKVKQ